MAQHGVTPQNYRDGEIVFLPKAGKNKELQRMDHLGQAYSRGLIQPYMPKIAPRGTREAILLVSEVMERFRSVARHRKS